MTNKDYVLIAEILRAHKVEKQESVQYYERWLKMVIAFEDALAADNPSFRRAEFLEYCHALTTETARFLKLAEKKE